MKHAFKLLALAALPMMWSCAADEPLAPEQPGEIMTRTVYIAVNLQDVNVPKSQNITRAGDEESFVFGSAEEHNVKSGNFFFFDENENYIGTGHLQRADWSGDKPTGYPDKDENANNVEWFGRNIITAPVKDGTIPKYVITVLNPPKALTNLISLKGQSGDLTMAEVGKELAINYDPFVYTNTQVEGQENMYNPNKPGDFMMSTTTFSNVEGNKDVSYYYTVIEENLIKGSLSEAADVDNDDVLKIYVERLAAKVTMEIDNAGAQLVDGKYVFPINGPVLVNPILDDNNNIIGWEDEMDGVNNVKLYCRVEGWGLSGTARHSYVSKQIDKVLTSTLLNGWHWSDSKNRRSYWGEGIHYDALTNDQYEYLGANDGPNTPYPNTDNFKLQFINWNQLVGNVKFSGEGEKEGIDYALYCLEHTNKPDYFSLLTNGKNKLLSKNLTCAIVKATVGRMKDDKFESINVIRYNGNLIPEDNLVDFVLYSLDRDGHFNYYTRSEKTDENGEKIISYDQLKSSNFSYALSNVGTGIIELFVNDDIVKIDKEGNVTVNTKLYKQVYNKKENKVEFKELEDADYKGLNENINNWGNAMGYTDGAMYYIIPIKHLNGTPGSEGEYGVVRNHAYRIKVNKIEKMGYGVYKPGRVEDDDPGEPIIPEDPDPEQHLKAEIRVLSWKIVNQSTDL